MLTSPVEPGLPSPAGGNGPADRFREKAKRLIIGPPRDLSDRSLFHKLSLVPILAWVGLGADGLSSSCYGPEEAFRTLGEHAYLAIGIAGAMTLTVSIIAIAYSRVIEHFPHGGGGYLVATKLLGERAGVVSGNALLVDYVLTISVSIAAAGDALFSFLPLAAQTWKVPAEIGLILFMIVLNLRGVRESALALAPVFLLFVVIHLVLIAGGILVKAPHLPATLHAAHSGFSHGLLQLGAAGLFLLFIHAYSLGGGTYTGIEAVSNGLAFMREPRVETGKRTMLYMAVSLAFTASGLIFCYLLWNVAAVPGKTMNAVLVERFVTVVPLGRPFIILTLLSEGVLLGIAAEAGFDDGPRVLANMAVDSWVPRRFGALSDRLTTRNGILMMGFCALASLLYTWGDTRHLVIMYSINVFATFSLTEFSMCRFYFGGRASEPRWMNKISIHVIGLVMCLTILFITVFEKFLEGGWLTLCVTGILVGICFLIRRHYRRVGEKLAALFAELEPAVMQGPAKPLPGPLDPQKPTAAVLMASYSGIGIHTILNAFRMLPGHFQNLVFISAGVIDSRRFRGGKTALEELHSRTEEDLKKYVALAEHLGFPATYRYAIGHDALDEAEKLCLGVSRDFPHVTFFAGKIVWNRPKWYDPILHNEIALGIQQRLEFSGKTVVIIPAKVAG